MVDLDKNINMADVRSSTCKHSFHMPAALLGSMSPPHVCCTYLHLTGSGPGAADS